MQRDLQEAYIPACVECQCNKSQMSKPVGPLHPLPIPDAHGDSIAIDFIGPLPVDNGIDCIRVYLLEYILDGKGNFIKDPAH
jgi:hypothetical protein